MFGKTISELKAIKANLETDAEFEVDAPAGLTNDQKNNIRLAIGAIETAISFLDVADGFYCNPKLPEDDFVFKTASDFFGVPTDEEDQMRS